MYAKSARSDPRAVEWGARLPLFEGQFCADVSRIFVVEGGTLADGRVVRLSEVLNEVKQLGDAGGTMLDLEDRQVQEYGSVRKGMVAEMVALLERKDLVVLSQGRVRCRAVVTPA